MVNLLGVLPPCSYDPGFNVLYIYSYNKFNRLSVYDTTINIEGEAVEDDKKSDDGKGKEEDIYADSYTNPKFRDIPMIYACATMWHENKQEMMQIMKSLFR